MLIPPQYLNQIIMGDARELSKDIPNESIDLIFTDPVYDRIDDYLWLAETAARVLKPRGHLVAFYQTTLNRETANALCEGGMKPYWTLIVYRNGGPNPRNAFGFTKASLAHFCIKSNVAMWQHNLIDVIETVTVSANTRHQWQKDSKAIKRWIYDLTTSDQIVLDPFAGSGTVSAACKELGRKYIAFEINQNTVETARQHVQATPSPLFITESETIEMTF